MSGWIQATMQQNTIPGQNGIWVKFYHFWPKNDGENWSRKNIFEIPPCKSHFLLIHFT